MKSLLFTVSSLAVASAVALPNADADADPYGYLDGECELPPSASSALVSAFSSVSAAAVASVGSGAGMGYGNNSVAQATPSSAAASSNYMQASSTSTSASPSAAVSSTSTSSSSSTLSSSSSAAGTTTSTSSSSAAGTTTSTSSPASAAAITGGPSSTPTNTTSTNSTGSNAGNPFAGKQLYANPFYASEISASAIPAMTASAAAASAVAKVGTFVWLDKTEKVPIVGEYLGNIAKSGSSNTIAGFVVYNLPNRDCSASASNGEYSVANDGLSKYKGYIDAIKTQIQKYTSVPVALIIEPDSLGNLVTNLGTPNCSAAQSAYKSGIQYAISTLDLPNVAQYLDAGHAGWLGWPANIGPAAQLFGQIYKAAGSPKSVRGLATNVANYNAFSIATCPSYTQGSKTCDEKSYINNLAPLLQQNGYPAHFIIDSSRNGKQPTGQQAWGDWCNIKGTGFGSRFTTDTGDPLADAFAWIKPGGECDGTSNATAPRYDSKCSGSDSLTPAPQAGDWFQAEFEMLVTNANPAFS